MNRISRRRFLESTAAGSLAVQTALGAGKDERTGMPMRVLGKTGAKVSIIAFGGGSRFLMYKDEDKGLEAVNKAIDSGINYLDTAFAYGNGQSETRIGKLMKTRRKDVWLATKVSARGADDAMRSIEGSLKRLQTNQVDLLHIHNLAGAEDLAAVEAGVLKVIQKCKEQKMTRFIGVTSHTDPATLKTALERHEFDCTQMALNAARVGMRNGQGGMIINDALKDSFELMALPVANRKKMGVIAMKIFGQEQLVGKAPIDKLIRYALTLPVSVAVLGMPQLSYLEENIQVAKAFQPMSKGDMKVLANEMLPHKAALDLFFENHIDA